MDRATQRSRVVTVLLFTVTRALLAMPWKLPAVVFGGARGSVRWLSGSCGAVLTSRIVVRVRRARRGRAVETVSDRGRIAVLAGGG